MALQLLNGVGAGVSRVLDIRSVGTRMVPFTIYGAGTVANPQTAPIVVEKGPTPLGPWVNLGTINPPEGQVRVDEPIDYVRITTDPGETGVVSAYVSTSR